MIEYIHCNRLKNNVNKIVNWFKWSTERSFLKKLFKIFRFCFFVWLFLYFLIRKTFFQRKHFSKKCHFSFLCSVIRISEQNAKNWCFSIFNFFVSNWFENKKQIISTIVVNNLILTKNEQQRSSFCNDKNSNEIDLYRKIKTTNLTWTFLKKIVYNEKFIVRQHFAIKNDVMSEHYDFMLKKLFFTSIDDLIKYDDKLRNRHFS